MDIEDLKVYLSQINYFLILTEKYNTFHDILKKKKHYLF